MIWEVDQPEDRPDGVDAAGRPDPAYAAALGLIRAPFGRRSLSFVIDAVIWVLLQLPLWLGAVPLLLKLATGSISPYGFLNHPDFVLAVVMAAVSVALSLVFAIVQWVLHARRGFTVGKAVTGLRSVNVRTLERPGAWPVLLRLVLVGAAGIVPAFGTAVMLASPTFDPQERGRGLHDRAARMWLVDARRGLNPYDEKRMRVARKTVKADPVPERPERPSLATATRPGEVPDYRPGNRISAGVLGVGRSPEAPIASGEPAPAPVPDGVIDAAPGMEESRRTPPPQRGTLATGAVPGPAQSPVDRSRPGHGLADDSRPAPTPAPAAAPREPAPAAAPAAPTTPRLALRFDTGDVIEVDRPIVVGRDPDSAGVPGAHPIRLRDESRSLSKTHALVLPAGGGVEVVDRHSTNGTAVVRAGVEQAASAGSPISAAVGDTVRLGDRLAEVVLL